jgi:hypothetical protein
MGFTYSIWRGKPYHTPKYPKIRRCKMGEWSCAYYLRVRGSLHLQVHITFLSFLRSIQSILFSQVFINIIKCSPNTLRNFSNCFTILKQNQGNLTWKWLLDGYGIWHECVRVDMKRNSTPHFWRSFLKNLFGVLWLFDSICRISYELAYSEYMSEFLPSHHKRMWWDFLDPCKIPRYIFGLNWEFICERQ